jgi:hypothetical protein
MTQSGHAMRRLGQINTAGMPYAAPSPSDATDASVNVRFRTTLEARTRTLGLNKV